MMTVVGTRRSKCRFSRERRQVTGNQASIAAFALTICPDTERPRVNEMSSDSQLD